MALIGRSTRTVRIADRLRLSVLTAYSIALTDEHTHTHTHNAYGIRIHDTRLIILIGIISGLSMATRCTDSGKSIKWSPILRWLSSAIYKAENRLLWNLEQVNRISICTLSVDGYGTDLMSKTHSKVRALDVAATMRYRWWRWPVPLFSNFASLLRKIFFSRPALLVRLTGLTIFNTQNIFHSFVPPFKLCAPLRVLRGP